MWDFSVDQPAGGLNPHEFLHEIQDFTTGGIKPIKGHYDTGFPQGYYDYDPPSNVRTNSGGMTTVDKFIGLGSQIISAWGKNPTQTYVPKYGAVQNQYYTTQQAAAVAGAQTAQANANAQILAAQQQQPQLSAGESGGGAAENAFSGITKFVKENPVAVVAGAAALFLLFKQPPGKR